MQDSVVPSFKEFQKAARKGNLIPLSLEVVADQVTPVALAASFWENNDYCALLESVEGGENLGRYSIVAGRPEVVFEEVNGHTEVRTPQGKVLDEIKSSALNAVEQYMKSVKPVVPANLPRFFGGAIGMLNYEAVSGMERIPRTNPDDLGWPDGQFMIANDLFIFDNSQQVLKIVTCVRLDRKTSAKKAYEQGRKHLLENLQRVADAAKTIGLKTSVERGANGAFTSTMDKPAFMKAVKQAKTFIGKGDIIQVVLSRRSEKKTSATPLEIYRCLRVVNPSPYMYLMKFKSRAVIGSSPESLVRLEGEMCATRPIAGTRRRGQNEADDQRLEKELLADPKERAEHLMLVDLGRNDLGRVCQYGSVKVPRLMVIERYSHVMHIVSEVVGKIKPGKTSFDLLKACFPAGTVSGAPKIRAMEIIDELENTQRGPYAGAIGYFSYGGNMDMAITIRTILYQPGKISIQTGAGLVADSDPASEYQETENKAAGMKKAIELAETGRLFWKKS